MDFLKKFLSWTSVTEVHSSHAMWAGLSSLSSIIGKKVWLEHGHFNVYCNIYTVFVAPPGCRKGTAMNFSEAMTNEVMGRQKPTNGFTKEALVSVLADNAVAFQPTNGSPAIVYTPFTIYASELTSLIGMSKDIMIDFLCDIYDRVGDWGVSTIKHREQIITNPYMVMLACTNPDWITMRLKDYTITGGFSSRVLYIYEPDLPRRVFLPSVTPEIAADWKAAVEYGKELKKVSGTFKWEQNAFRFAEKWYMNRPKSSELTTQAYNERKMMHLFKLAMLFSLSESPELVLKLEHLETAMKWLNAIEQNLPKIFAHIGRNELHSVAATVQEAVRAVGGYMAERQILNAMHAHATERELMQVLEHLVLSDKLLMIKLTDGKKYYCTDQKAVEYFRRERERVQAMMPKVPMVPPKVISNPD